MLDAGWLQFAKDELDRLKRDFTGEMPKDAKEQYEKLLKEIDQNDRGAVVARGGTVAGRRAVQVHVATCSRSSRRRPPARRRSAACAQRDRRPEDRSGALRHRPAAAPRRSSTTCRDARGQRPASRPAAGWRSRPGFRRRTRPAQTLDLAAAGEQVYAELHPDSAERIETFVTLAVAGREATAAGARADQDAGEAARDRGQRVGEGEERRDPEPGRRVEALGARANWCSPTSAARP